MAFKNQNDFYALKSIKSMWSSGLDKVGEKMINRLPNPDFLRVKYIDLNTLKHRTSSRDGHLQSGFNIYSRNSF